MKISWLIIANVWFYFIGFNKYGYDMLIIIFFDTENYYYLVDFSKYI